VLFSFLNSHMNLITYTSCKLKHYLILIQIDYHFFKRPLYFNYKSNKMHLIILLFFCFHLSSRMLRSPCVKWNFLNFLFLQLSEKFGFWSSAFFWKYLVFSNSWKFHENSLEISLEIISCFWVKTFGKCLENFWKSNWKTFGIYGKFGICSIPNFTKITKNEFKIEFRKSQKTHSNSKTDLNNRVKVRNPGP